LDFQNSLDLELSSADAVRLVPVHFGMTHRTIGELDRRRSFQLPPAVTAIEFS
jgi:hypothetical protein